MRPSHDGDRPADTSRRVVVTGVAGFIGSHLAEALLARGDHVTGVDALTDSYPRPYKESNLRALVGHPRFRFHDLDLRHDELQRVVEDADVVVNQAALPGLPRSWSDLRAYVDCNLLGLGRLLDACRHAGVPRFVQASTSSVYGIEAVGDETAPTHPVSPYGVTKLAAEHLLLAHVHTHDFPAVILRYFSIYGPRQRPDMAYHIFIEALREGRPVTVYGDGAQSRSNTYVADCVRGTLLAIEGAHLGETYNIGGGTSLELREAIELISRELGVVPQLVHRPPRPGDQRHTMADTAKAAETFGYRPRTNPPEGLGSQVRWHLAELPVPSVVSSIAPGVASP
jgi:UDP-glucuronate 4-epimerase